MLRSMLVDARIAFTVDKRPPFHFGNNTLRVRSLCSVFTQLIPRIAERSRRFILKEVIEPCPEERGRLFDDGLIGHEHLPQLPQLFVSVKLILIVGRAKVVTRVRGRASWKLIPFTRKLFIDQIFHGAIFVHHVIFIIQADFIVTLRPSDH